MLTRKNKPSQSRLLGVIDIGTSKVSCAIVQVEPNFSERDGDLNLRLLGLATLPSHGIKAGTIFNLDVAEDSVRATIDQAAREAQVSIESLTVAIACGRPQSRRFTAKANISGGTVASTDLDKLRRAATGYLNRDGRGIIDLVELDYRLNDVGGIRNPVGMAGDRLAVDLHAVTADESVVRNLVLLVERCHIRANAIAVAGCASALATTTAEERQSGITCIDIGAGTTLLASFQHGQFVWTDLIATGGAYLSYDIANTLKMPLAEAERIKTFYGTVARAGSDNHQLISLPRAGGASSQASQITRAELRQIIQPRVEGMLAAIREHLDSAMRRGDIDRIAASRIVLTGGASELMGLPAFAAGVLARPVRFGLPTPMPGLPASMAAAPLATLNGLLVLASRSQHLSFSTARSGLTTPDYLDRCRQWINDRF